MIASGVVGFGPGTTGVMVCGVVVVTVGLVAGIVGVTLGSGSVVTAGGVAGFGPGTIVGVMVCGVVVVTVGFVGETCDGGRITSGFFGGGMWPGGATVVTGDDGGITGGLKVGMTGAPAAGGVADLIVGAVGKQSSCLPAEHLNGALLVVQFVRPPVVKHVCSEQVYCPGPPVHCCVMDAFVGGAAGEVAEGAGPGLGGKITSGLVGIGPGGFDTPGCTAVTGGNGAGVGVAPGITAGLVWGGSCGGVLSMMTIPGEWAGGRPTTTGDRGCADVIGAGVVIALSTSA